MRFLLAGPSGVRQLDLNGLMLELGADEALEASRRAETEPVVQVCSDPIRLVRLMAPGDERLSFTAMLGMLPGTATPPAIPPVEPRFPAPEEDDEALDEVEDLEEVGQRSVATLGDHVQSRLAQAMAGREEPFTVAEVIELMVADHESEAFAYRNVEGELTIKVPVSLLVAAARTDDQARRIVQAFNAGDELTIEDGEQQCGILWSPERALSDAAAAISQAASPADADWSIQVEQVQKLSATKMRALARRIVTDMVQRVEALRAAELDRTDAMLGSLIRKQLKGS